MSVRGDGAVSKIEFLPHGDLLASVSTQGELEIWKVGSDTGLLKAARGEPAHFVSISDSATKAIVSSEEGWTLFMNTMSTMAFHTEKPGLSSLFSPNGEYLAVRTPCCLEIVRQADGNVILKLKEPDQEPDPTDSTEMWENESGINLPRFSIDDNFLAENAWTVWDLRTGKQSSQEGPQESTDIWGDVDEIVLNGIKVQSQCLPHNDCDADSKLTITKDQKEVKIKGVSPLKDFAISHSGEFAALLNTNSVIQVFSVETGQELFRVQMADVSALAFSGDDRQLLLSTSDGTVYKALWKTRDILAETCRRLSRGLTAEEWSRYANGSYEAGCTLLK